MLRVGGVTYCHTANYGTSLQAYALQQAIEKIEIDGEPCSYKLICLRDCKDYPERYLERAKFLGNVFRSFNRKRFRRFEDKKIHFRFLKELKELPGLNREFDAFVCGSDVIWNPEFNEGLSAFYLDFAEKYAFSYAASFGKDDVPFEKLDKYADAIGRLRQIGLREKSAEEIVCRYTRAPVYTVVDPVLLLTGEEWSRIAGKKRAQQKQIVVYSTHETEEFKGFVEKLRQETGLPVKRLVWGKTLRSALRSKVLFIARQPEWLRMIRDAEYVVTNSFHATVFSILFEKKFFTVVHGEKDQGRNIRMYDFLKQLGLEDRIRNAVPETIEREAPDYTAVMPGLEALRSFSLRFLRENLEAAAREKQAE